MDETDIKVAGEWKYLYPVVDRAGETVDFLLTAKRDKGRGIRVGLQCAKICRVTLSSPPVNVMAKDLISFVEAKKNPTNFH